MLSMRLLRKVLYFQGASKHANPLSYPSYTFAKDIPASLQRTHWNLFQAINSGIDVALETDQT